MANRQDLPVGKIERTRSKRGRRRQTADKTDYFSHPVDLGRREPKDGTKGQKRIAAVCAINDIDPLQVRGCSCPVAACIGDRARCNVLGWPEEQARAALFLAWNLSSYVTGHNMPVDGGTKAGGGWFFSPKDGRFANRPTGL